MGSRSAQSLTRTGGRQRSHLVDISLNAAYLNQGYVVELVDEVLGRVASVPLAPWGSAFGSIRPGMRWG